MAHIDHIQMLRNVQEWTPSRDLAIKSGLRRDSTTRVLKRMVAAGYLEARHSAPNRLMTYKLTEAGQALLKKSEPPPAKVTSNPWESLGERVDLGFAPGRPRIY